MKENRYMLIFLVLVAFQISGLSTEASEKDKISAKEYEIVVAKEKNNVAKVTTMGKSGYHCNTMYPWKLTVKDKNGKETVYKKNDATAFSEKNVIFKAVGTTATLKLSVCNDQQCIMKTENITL